MARITLTLDEKTIKELETEGKEIGLKAKDIIKIAIANHIKRHKQKIGDFTRGGR